MDVGESLATLNALLNATSALLAGAAFVAIRRGHREAHKRLMSAALIASSLFLVSYLTRVALTGTHRYPGEGWARAAYFAILGTHTVLAAAVVPLVLAAAWLALRLRRYPAHKKVGRIALPIWLYVSLTGVLVYLMLYRWV